MTTAPIEYGISKDTVTPSMIVSSFLPVSWRDRAAPWIHRLPLGLILAFQSSMALRLHNTAFRDEALYIWTGHRVFAHWLHGAVLYDNPARYFSGSPYVYPPLAAMVDDVGGLFAVRLFSLLCMLAATIAIFSVSQRLFNRMVALIGALAFAAAGPTQHLSHFATFDALSLSLIAVATAVGVRAVQNHRLAYTPLVALLLAGAVASKYAALLFVPFVLGVIFLTASQRLFSQRVSILSFLIFVGLMVALVATVGHSSYVGFQATTSQRKIILTADPWAVAKAALGYAWAWYVLSTAGLVVAMRQLRRYWLAPLLYLGMLAPVLYQAYIGELVSLDKHIDFGLVFGVPLIGILFSRCWTKVTYKAAITASMVAIIILGAADSKALFNEWSNDSSLVSVLGYTFKAAPYVHTLGEPVEPIKYAFEHKGKYWQFDSTDPIVALYYKPTNGPAVTGMAAAEAGLKAGYWQLVYFDNSTEASRTLTPMMKGFGYKITDTVKMQNSYGPDTYTVWQRWTPTTG